MKKFYLINKKTDTLETFENVEDFAIRFWGAYIQNYILVVSTKDGDFFLDLRITRGDLGQLESILKLY
jgi:hypothetical protein